jgi:hypothetical protein
MTSHQSLMMRTPESHKIGTLNVSYFTLAERARPITAAIDDGAGNSAGSKA